MPRSYVSTDYTFFYDIPSNYNHRPCRWFAQAPLGPITGRAYRLTTEFLLHGAPCSYSNSCRVLLYFISDISLLRSPSFLLIHHFARIFFLGIASIDQSSRLLLEPLSTRLRKKFIKLLTAESTIQGVSKEPAEIIIFPFPRINAITCTNTIPAPPIINNSIPHPAIVWSTLRTFFIGFLLSHLPLF